MSYDAWRTLHSAGVGLLVAGLVGVLIADLRARTARTRLSAATAAAMTALLYDAVVVPGALLLGGAGAVMVAAAYGWGVLDQPWLAAMIVLFALEFVEGNTITRRAFRRLKRLTPAAPPPDLEAARQAWLPAFTHFLDLPMVLVIIGLGIFRPMDWTAVLVAIAAALAAAVVLTAVIRRLLPWRS